MVEVSPPFHDPQSKFMGQHVGQNNAGRVYCACTKLTASQKTIVPKSLKMLRVDKQFGLFGLYFMTLNLVSYKT